jgi:branched-chain amino acid transport system ATP-binding protein
MNVVTPKEPTVIAHRLRRWSRPSGHSTEPVADASAISTSDLEVGYGDLDVLRGISLHVQAGEIVALLGPNGAGKTTLLNAIAGFLRPTAGVVSLFGRQSTAQPHIRARQGLAFIADDRNLLPNLTTRENLRMMKRSPKELLSIFPELCQKMALRGGLLSGGEQQMVALGRALISGPKALLIDELSLGLAPIVRDRLLTRLRAEADSGKAVLVVEQSVRSALAFADRAYVLTHGQIIAERSAAQWIDSLDDLSELFVS